MFGGLLWAIANVEANEAGWPLAREEQRPVAEQDLP